ncbi:hypothetical protein BGZ68_006338 [Mortierella alpina]|nr:hypothetical protein BGZ68_006338 [Mortierella alpina]
MRLTSTLTILSVAALASAKILRNTASNLCLDVRPDFYPGARLSLSPCDELKNGDWTIEVRGKTSAIIKNNKLYNDKREMCVGIFEYTPKLVLCHAAVELERLEDTDRKKWSFSTVSYGEHVVLASGPEDLGSGLEFWPLRFLPDDDRRWEWSTLPPKKTMYQELYSWMRYRD